MRDAAGRGVYVQAIPDPYTMNKFKARLNTNGKKAWLTMALVLSVGAVAARAQISGGAAANSQGASGGTSPSAPAAAGSVSAATGNGSYVAPNSQSAQPPNAPSGQTGSASSTGQTDTATGLMQPNLGQGAATGPIDGSAPPSLNPAGKRPSDPLAGLPQQSGTGLSGSNQGINPH